LMKDFVKNRGVSGFVLKYQGPRFWVL